MCFPAESPLASLSNTTQARKRNINLVQSNIALTQILLNSYELYRTPTVMENLEIPMSGKVAKVLVNINVSSLLEIALFTSRT